MTLIFRRTIRDPIHGDIRITALENAVIDTREFQRLRYVRQNGLLHLVFPGAVHSRFAHSLGTMAIAGRVAERVLAPAVEAATTASHRNAIHYVTQVFRGAALLHDVGHAAFSHSIEHVRLEGDKPLFGTVGELLHRWKMDEMSARFSAEERDEPAHHEAIGRLLVNGIFGDAGVREACSEHQPASNFAQDILGIMGGGELSATMTESAVVLQGLLAQREADIAELGDRAFMEGLATVLHNLISGTMDVDRLDYLVRDSVFCGVPYGRCDVDLLVASLSVGSFEGRLSLLLDRKAANTLDDMLWSRFQLWIQVLNHKTNVGLNLALREALPEAIEDGRLDAPSTYEQFLGFTDDAVMAGIYEVAIKPGKTLREKSFVKLLVDRRLPEHVHQVRVGRKEISSPEFRAEHVQEIMQRCGVTEDKLLISEATSELVKDAPLPTLVYRDRTTGVRHHQSFWSSSTFARKLLRDGGFEYHNPASPPPSDDTKHDDLVPAFYGVLHFFRTR